MASPIEKVYDDGHTVVGVMGDLTLCVMRGPIEPACFDATEQAHRRILKAHPDGVLSLTVCRATTEIPGPKVQMEAARKLNVVGKTLRTSVVVLEGGGFWRAAALSTITGIQLLLPRLRRLEMRSDVPSAVKRIQEIAGKSNDWHKAVVEAVEAIAPKDL